MFTYMAKTLPQIDVYGEQVRSVWIYIQMTYKEANYEARQTAISNLGLLQRLAICIRGSFKPDLP